MTRPGGGGGEPPSLLPTHALDQALAGVTAGLVSTVCMQPLDLLKVQLQVSTTTAAATARSRGGGGAFVQIRDGLRSIARNDGGLRGWYRGIGPNLVGNASSWGFYFLWYTDFKKRMVNGDESKKLNAGQHLVASASSGIVTAVLTNPLWVVKTRMYTTSRSSPRAYTGVLNGLYRLFREEGFRGGAKGMTLALVGVSNGAIQFMTYEELKKWRVELRRKRIGGDTTTTRSDQDLNKLSNLEYILMSGSAKLVAISITYPYQVIRSRIQYQPQMSSSSLAPGGESGGGVVKPYTSIANVVSRTWRHEGVRGFYRGIATNAVRILPGTCVTFVVYEQVSRALSNMGEQRLRRGRDDEPSTTTSRSEMSRDSG
ncbi:hypothetical protein JCM3766R1_003506 [Sporobolomyces carnicolor]